MNYLPFEVQNKFFAVIADVSRPEFVQLFEKHNFQSNGYAWEGHILLILEKIAPELIPHIEFDPADDMFIMKADSAENQQRFVEILAPVFQDLDLLNSYIAAADPDMIDD